MAMTRENIVQMAMKAGFIVGNAPPKIDVYWQRLEDFAALIAAAEREACAKVCNELADDAAKNQDFHVIFGCESCAEEIRARGQ